MPTVEVTPRIEAFWHRFQAARPDLDTSRGYFEAFSFGNDDRMADELAGRVRTGVKTATSELLRAYDDHGGPTWRAGDFHIVTWASGEPACVIRTAELRTVRFDEVDERFAFDYGEGERTLAWWREKVGAYYEAECARRGWAWTGRAMPVVCERFVVVSASPPAETGEGARS